MTDFRIFETEEFIKSLNRLDLKKQRLVESKLGKQIYPQLRNQPYYGPHIRKLRGYKPEIWRYRIGNYRIFFAINEQTRVVAMLTIDDRKDSYQHN